MSEIFNPRRAPNVTPDTQPAPQPPVGEGIGHSGNLGLEFPQEKHLGLTDGHDLDEKLARRLKRPKTTEDLDREPKLRPKRSRVYAAIAAGAIGIAGVVGGGIALSQRGAEEAVPEDTNNSAEPLPQESEAPVPQETEAPVETGTEDAFIESFEMKADQYTSFDEVVAGYVENNQNWMNAGLSLEGDTSLLTTDPEASAANVSAKFDGPITEKMFTGSATSQELVQSAVSTLRHSVEIAYWLSMSRGDAVTYAIDFELQGSTLVTSDAPEYSDATTFTAQVDTHITDNAAENIAPYLVSIGEPGQLDVLRNDEVTFVLDSSTNTWEVDRSVLKSSEDNSK